MSAVVLGYVPNALGDAAAKAAVDEAHRRGASLVVVNTTRADRLVDPAYADDDDMSRLQETLQGTGVDFTVHHGTSRDTAAEDVLDAAERNSAELIVIGLRHRTPVGKLIMGSTAQSILLGARCNVLAVKA
ncbi:Nucleotide-binding universal stress protein, UspA family [Arthrobacter subterraneus]|uniref:Nucleotide-binding universal stress protein, UspA family n=1 Tax=Arthrobacter subterraneus TaxID=335973 RepID=A0A1G8L742_9MICC|nr:universal stress protein [Arthrobacter subterraneus]SDI51432.1 Nucleotide-binding universal stress protein, UspA family [Arthrobacter subterraneus]